MRPFSTMILSGALAVLPLTALAGAETPTSAAAREAPAALAPAELDDDASDLRITESIRDALARSHDLSPTARNATIVTVDREVTLRGPVETADEKQRIGAMAQGTPGVVRIRNELEVRRRR